MIISIIKGINAVFSLFYITILIRCALSFIPGLDWKKQPYKTVIEVTDPYLNIFRNFIPPLGMVDISPIVAIIALGIIQKALIYAIAVLALGF